MNDKICDFGENKNQSVSTTKVECMKKNHMNPNRDVET